MPAGRFAMGAGAEGFSYDNERPRHEVELAGFAIARHPVTNATWLTFAEGGGYERREWWSDEGWAWKEEYDIGVHPSVAAGDLEAPVCHVSWFEADAFARAQGARLPTEQEWERAATWEQQPAAVGSVWEWTATNFVAYPGFSRIPIASTRRSSSAIATACCAAARGRPTRASRRHLPQLGPARAAPDLRRPAAGQGRSR